MPAEEEDAAEALGVVSVRETAERKDCSHQAVYKALDAGKLNDVRTGGLRLVRTDDAFEAWQPKPYGEHRQPEGSGNAPGGE